MLTDIRNIKSGKHDLRKFGITVGIVLCILGGLLLWRGREYCRYLFYAGGAFLVLGAAAPAVLWPIQKVWMTVAVVLGWIMTRVILSILFYLVITPTGLLSRIFGKRFLDLDFGGKRDSYWIPKKKTHLDKSDYERQF